MCTEFCIKEKGGPQERFPCAGKFPAAHLRSVVIATKGVIVTACTADAPSSLPQPPSPPHRPPSRFSTGRNVFSRRFRRPCANAHYGVHDRNLFTRPRHCAHLDLTAVLSRVQRQQGPKAVTRKGRGGLEEKEVISGILKRIEGGAV
ncbi:hypothetical protein KM043_005864 [Ampulex compressa]|nr:hypothetical protein KM043_005864 [Ampulex compressa]